MEKIENFSFENDELAALNADLEKLVRQYKDQKQHIIEMKWFEPLMAKATRFLGSPLY